MATVVDETTETPPETDETTETDDDETNEQLDDETTDPPADEPEDAVPSEKEMEKALAKLDAEQTRHSNRVSEIMGEDAQVLERCPLCAPNIAGFRFPAEPDDETKRAVRAAIGDLHDDNFKPTEDARRCEKCDGLGQVLTGSLVPTHRTKPCGQCQGAGWVVVGGPGQTPPTPGAPTISAPIAEPLTETPPDVDPWGRRQGDPLYGVMPGYEGARASG